MDETNILEKKEERMHGVISLDGCGIAKDK